MADQSPRRASGLLLASLALLVQCDRTPAPPAASSAAPVESESPDQRAEPPPPAPRAAPRDLELASLEADLGCKGGRGGKKACRILAEFAAAERWEGKLQSGMKRLMGKAYVVEKGTEREELSLVLAKTVPLAKVGPGELPLLLGTAPVPDEQRSPAEKLYKRLARGDTPRRADQVLPYVETFEPAEEILGAVSTEGKSLLFAGETEVHVRQQGIKKLLLVRLDIRPSARKGDGVYSEVWSVIW